MKLKPFIVILAIFFSTVGCGEIGELKELLNDLKAENERLLTELELLNSRLDEYDTKLMVILASLEENAEEMQALKEKVDSLTAQLIEQLAKIDALKDQLDQQNANIDKLTEEIRVLKDKCDELKALIEELLAGKSPIPTEGLVAWYPFNGNADDESGNKYNAEVFGANLIVDRFGNENQSYSFENDDYIESIIPQTSAFTISVWFNLNDYNTFYTFVQHKDKRIRGAGPYLGITEATGLYRYGHNSCGEFSVTPCANGQYINFNGAVIPIESWHHGVVTSDGEGVFRFFYDGQQIGGVNSPEMPAQYGEKPFSIGLHADDINIAHFNGKLDDVGLWNRALSPDEITKIYQGEKF